jgi:serine/threonine-protein kinase
VLDQQGPTRGEPALTVLNGSPLVLGVAHAAGVLHRDFKPETPDGTSKLTDLGIVAPQRRGAATTP